VNSERYARVREIFLATCEQPESERAEFVAARCGADGELRRAVEELLSHRVESSQFLESPALGRRIDEGELSRSQADELAAGAVLEHGAALYRIVRKRGEGGFGEVYEAEQERPVRRRVALKLLKAGMDSRAVLARFSAESQALASLDHPFVAKVFDAGLAPNGRPYFAMELVEGEPITAFCARHALDLRARLELFRRVCDAVQHTHHKGLIHRDLKPSNVLVGVGVGVGVGGGAGDPRPKVIDFGVAKAIGADDGERSALTQAGVLLGTPAYMSPEQAGRDVRDVDTRSDVYSLGALLYELLTGAPPFDIERLRSASLAEIVRIVCDEEPARPSVRAASSPSPPFAARELRGDLDWIAMRALEKDRERRYASPSEFSADLARHLAHEPVLARRPSAAYRAAKFARRNRLAVGAAAMLALALTGGLATTLWQAGVARSQRDLARDAAIDARAQAAAAQEARARAEAKTESVLAGLEFVNVMFSAARPDVARGAETTVREVLDHASLEADRALAGKPPEVEAHVRSLIGNAYRSLSRFDDARAHLERSYTLFVDTEGETAPETLRALNDLAALDGDQGRFDDAEQRYRKSIELCTRALGESHLRTRTAKHNLAQVLRRRGATAEAKALLVELCDAPAGATEGEQRFHLVACHNLAGLLAQGGDFEGAIERERAVLASQRELLGPDHPDVLESMSNLASMLANAGSVDEADAMFAETLSADRRVFGADHVATAATEINVASIRRYQGRLAEAVELYEHALATRRARLGDSHVDTRAAEQRLELARHELDASREPAEH
jgi:serine/threonine protein kinase